MSAPTNLHLRSTAFQASRRALGRDVVYGQTWGFSVPSGPRQFSTNGWRINARSTLEPSDLVVIVGTKGAETDEDE